MACKTCDHTMKCLAVAEPDGVRVFWCWRCGTVKLEPPFRPNVPHGPPPTDWEVPKWTERCARLRKDGDLVVEVSPDEPLPAALLEAAVAMGRCDEEVDLLEEPIDPTSDESHIECEAVERHKAAYDRLVAECRKLWAARRKGGPDDV